MWETAPKETLEKETHLVEQRTAEVTKQIQALKQDAAVGKRLTVEEYKTTRLQQDPTKVTLTTTDEYYRLVAAAVETDTTNSVVEEIHSCMD